MALEASAVAAAAVAVAVPPVPATFNWSEPRTIFSDQIHTNGLESRLLLVLNNCMTPNPFACVNSPVIYSTISSISSMFVMTFRFLVSFDCFIVRSVETAISIFVDFFFLFKKKGHNGNGITSPEEEYSHAEERGVEDEVAEMEHGSNTPVIAEARSGSSSKSEVSYRRSLFIDFHHRSGADSDRFEFRWKRTTYRCVAAKG